MANGIPLSPAELNMRRVEHDKLQEWREKGAAILASMATAATAEVTTT